MVCCELDTSGIWCCRQWLSLAWSRPASTTLAPSRTNREAMASPMAPVAPVTTAVLPARERRAISGFVLRSSIVSMLLGASLKRFTQLQRQAGVWVRPTLFNLNVTAGESP